MPDTKLRGVILVIDDDASVLSYVTQILEGAGYGVRTASDGRSGLEAYQQDRADMVITDLFMDHMDGLETIRRLRALNPSVLIVAITGGSQFVPGDYLGTAMRLGAGRALAKPFDAATLLEAVQSLLGT